MADLTTLTIPELNKQIRYYTRIVDSGRTSKAYAVNAANLIDDLKEEVIIRFFKTLSRSKQSVLLVKLQEISFSEIHR